MTSTTNMCEPHNRQRLRPWLEAQINSGKFPGLDWIHKAENIFKIPWKHGGKQDWSESDSLIFKEWAVHTGRFREGIDAPDWPSWKTRLRCALNKLPDINEMKDLSNLDGPSPFRVYKLLPKKGNGVHAHTADDSIRLRNGYNKAHTNRSDHHAGDYELQLKPNQSNIPTTVAEQNISGDQDREPRVSSLGSDLGNIDVKDLIPLNRVHSYSHVEEDMDTDENLVIDKTLYPTDAHTGAPSKSNRAGQLTSQTAEEWIQDLLMPTKMGPQDHEIIVKLKYRQTEVAVHHVKNASGCRLFYGPGIDTMDNKTMREQLFGPMSLDQLHFPLCDNLLDNQRQEKLTTQLLNVLDRGLILECVDGDIYASRKCRLVVFVAPPHLAEGQPIKLNRDAVKTKIFDFKNYFLPSLNRYTRGEGPRPSAEVLIGFGQDWKCDKQPYNNLLISATIFHAKAFYLLLQETPLTQLHISSPDDYDKFLDHYKHIEQEQAQAVQT